MFDEIEKIMKELAECMMDKHEIFEEINGIESANSYWESLSHNTRVEFLIKFLSCYFYYPENKMMIKHKPDFPKYKESKKMFIAYEEFKIIIKFILDNDLTLGISTRTLDERRKIGTDCPEFIEAKKGIMFPVQNVVLYQLQKTKQCIKVNY